MKERDIAIAVLEPRCDQAEHAEGKRDDAIAIGLDVDPIQHASSVGLDRVEPGGLETQSRQVDRLEDRWHGRAGEVTGA